MSYFECWNAEKVNPNGYGRTSAFYQGTRLAHRVAYMALVGPIPTGYQLHHRCENKRCYNPDHLEPTTAKDHPDSMAVRNRAKTHCRRGHEFTPENTYVYANGKRECKACNRASKRQT